MLLGNLLIKLFCSVDDLWARLEGKKKYSLIVSQEKGLSKGSALPLIYYIDRSILFVLFPTIVQNT